MKVFVSHSSTDKPFVSRLASDLRTKEGIDAWLDQWEINPGDRIPEKIEGFFDACSILGLTGTQGVIIPRRNAENLFIPDRMNEAVTSGRFHIWAIDTADEGLEILSGTSAKEFGDKVYTVLEDYAKRMQKCCK